MNRPEADRTLAIILNWRQPDVTLECVQALQAMHEPHLDILVIDNGSGDNSAILLAERQEGFRLLPLADNLGFAAGNNQGLRMALEEGYDYALLVNNDAFAAPDMLAHLFEETASDIGLLAPKIYYEAEPERIWFANGRSHPLTLDLRDTGQGELDGPQWAFSRDVDYLLGTCLLVNLSLASEVGLLDERYFFYFEDLDWSLRFRQAGYRLRLAAGAHLAHRVGLSTGGEEDSPLRRYYLAYGSVLFWRQHARLGSPLIIFAFRLLSGLKIVARLTLTGRLAVATAYLRGLRHGWQDSNQGEVGPNQKRRLGPTS
ncbi:MAG: glycosyltransferase [Chloroflexi bacterium]|nr:glycosyltransferase [Chloroflexota bacterium]